MSTRPANRSVSQPNTSSPSPAFPDPIPGIIPFGHVTLFAGEARVGKSPMLISWIPRWQTGRTIMGHPTNAPTGFYYLVGDRSWNAYEKWFERVGIPSVPHYAIDDDPTFNLNLLSNEKAAHQVLIESLAKLDMPPGATLIIEPYAPGFMNGDQNRSRDVAAGMHRLRRLCKERQINVIAMVHFHKQPSDESKQYRRFIDRISGSGAFAGYSDTQMYLIGADPPLQPYHIFGWNPPHAPEEQFNYVRGTDGLFSPYSGKVKASAEDREQQRERQEVEQLYGLLPDTGTIKTSELVDRALDAFTFSQASVYRYLTILEELGRVARPYGYVGRQVPQ